MGRFAHGTHGAHGAHGAHVKYLLQRHEQRQADMCSTQRLLGSGPGEVLPWNCDPSTFYNELPTLTVNEDVLVDFVTGPQVREPHHLFYTFETVVTPEYIFLSTKPPWRCHKAHESKKHDRG